ARVGLYVTSSGSARGDGSSASPWDLATALSQPSAVHPGDTIWLRGGTYRGVFTSTLTGTTAAPIIVRQYPAERTIIDGSMTINGADTWYWGFEVMNSSPSTTAPTGITVFGARAKLINLLVHAAGQ